MSIYSKETTEKLEDIAHALCNAQSDYMPGQAVSDIVKLFESEQKSPVDSSLKDTILNDILIHEERCMYSLYDATCDCVQLNVADRLVQTFFEYVTVLRGDKKI